MKTTETATHTPGPWRVDPSYDIPTVIAHCFPKGATCVAVVYGDDDAIMARVPGGTESMANARLIAAAPDLLQSLREMLSIVGNRLPIGAFAEQKARAVATLAIAEGR
jgi:hypothetical protein